MYGSGSGILSALEALQEAGVATTTYQNVQEWSTIKNILTNKGYVEVVNDAGVSRGWIQSITDVVGQTTTKTASSLPSVINNAGGVYDLSASEYLITDAGVASATGSSAGGSAFTALVTSPKAAVITAVLAAIGFTAGFDIGQWGYEHFFGDDDFDWKTDSIGGKIMTWLDKDGNAYISADLAERIKDVLIDNGLLEDNSIPTSFNYSDFTTVNPDSLEVTAEYLANTEVAYGNRYVIQALEQAKSLGFGELGGVGAIYGHFFDYPTKYRYEFISTDGNRIRGDNTTNIDIYFEDTVNYNACVLEVNPNLTQPVWSIIQEPTSGTRNRLFLNYSGTNVLMSLNLFDVIKELFIPKQQGATYPTQGHTIAQDYPTWWNNRKKVYTPDENDPNKWTDLLHVRIPTPDDDIQNQDDTQTQPETEEQLDEQAKTQEDIATDTGITDDVPTDDIGDTPAIAPPTSGAETGLVKLYNPSLNQLSAFSQWLWSNNIFDNFSKLFQDPMQAIIGLNLLYATPHNGTDSNIIVGNLDSSCPSKTIDQQYIEIDCGTVTVSRYFNNVLDYIATKIEVYLPFVGIVPMEVGDIIGKDVNIKCTVDVLTGTCLYQIYVGNQLLYTFTGNCAIQLPLSSANYSSVITGMIGLIGGGVATAVSGGALAPLAIGGAANMAANLKHGIERSGNIGANAGAMGVKKPYIIITRNRPYNPTAYNKYYGFPSNTTVKLSNCSGFTRVKDIRLHDIYTYDGDAKVVATDGEMSIIESQLKGGVII